jgi:glycosyltransferase involved in cell wall biosynthesis
MHILLLNEYYPPDTSATAKIAVHVVDALAERHRVTVLAGRPSYDPSEVYPWRLLRRQTRGNVTVECVGSTAYPRFRMKRRVANYLSYLALATPRALSLRPDVVLAMTDPPIAGIAGAVIAKLCKRPFVYNVRDMYPDMAVGGDIVRPSAWVQRWERMHRWALRSAARVIVLGEDMRERILAKGIEPHRITVVRDVVPFPPAPPAADHPVVREIRGGFPFVLVHAGNIGFYGAWKTLIAAAQLLEPDGVGLVFVGEGAMKADVQKLAEGSRNIRFIPFRPAAEVPHVMAAGDMHVITVKRGLEGVVVPSKVYNILAAGRPLLSIATNLAEISRFAERDGCGVAVDPDNPGAVAAAVRALIRDPTRLTHMSQCARELARTYDRVNELNTFVKSVEEASRK